MPDWCLPKAIRVGVAVAFLVAGAIVGGIAIGLYGEKNLGAKTRQAIAIDANSNSTTFYLYNWDRDDIFDDTNVYKKMGYIDMVESYTIYESVDDTDDVDYLINRGISRIFTYNYGGADYDSNKVKKTIAYFGATGETRADSEIWEETPSISNGPDSERIVDDVYSSLEYSSYKFAVNTYDVEVLPRDEEGKFGWIAVNNLKEHFTNEQKDPSYATLDMGGSSTQLSYESNDGKSVWIYGKDYNVTTESQLCYGIEESMRRFVALVVQESYLQNKNFTTTLNNPCMPPGTKSSIKLTETTKLQTFQATKEDIFFHPCTEMKNHEFGEGLFHILPDGYSFKMIPSYNKTECERIISTLIDSPEECRANFNKGDCFNSTAVSLPGGNFVAFNSYYSEFAKILDLTSGEGLSEIEDKVEGICSQVSSNGNAETDCFKITFILKLLIDGYGFEEDTFNNIEFAESLDGEEISWTSGQILKKSTDLESDGFFNLKKMTYWEFILTLLTGCILFIAGIAQLVLIYVLRC